MGDVQILYAFSLLNGRLARDSSVAGLDYGFVQPLVAALGVVGLLAAVVGLDDDGAGSLSDVARGSHLAVEGGGHMLQEGMERHLQSSFRIHS